MNFLFDTSPTEPTAKKSAKKRERAVGQPQPEAAFVHSPKSYGAGVQPIIGTIDHTYDCADAACGTQCHDIIREERGYWYVVCAFCGTGQWVPAVAVEKEKPKPSQDDVFRLRGGRFPGMTLDEVSRLEDGVGCIRWWAAGRGTADDVRDAARVWLDENEKKHLDKTVGAR